MENPIKMDDLGGKPLFFGNTHMGAKYRQLYTKLTIAGPLSQGHRTPGCEVANLHPAYASIVDH